MDNQFLKTNARVEVQVVEGKRFLKDVPHRLLGVTQEQVAVEGKDGLGQSLAETDLELHVAVIFVGLLVQWQAHREIGVLERPEKRQLVKLLDNTVGIKLPLVTADVSDLARHGAKHAGQHE